MLNTATLSSSTRTMPPALRQVPADESGADARTGTRIADMLKLLGDSLPVQRRVVREGETIYQAGGRFGNLYVLNSGFVKIINLSADGREQVASLKFRGDWLGFDGIADGQYGCDAVAMDTGEVWVIRYEDLLSAAASRPALLKLMHQAMSRELTRDRDSMMSVCTMPADARVADFLRYWADALSSRGMRADQFALRMSRAEIGNYLGMTIETVSRSLTKLARDKLIHFPEKGRRDVQIPCITALNDYIQACLPRASAVLH